jgi:nicotinamidase/pyrazinamidase
VKATALDAAKAGYTVAVVAGLSRGVAPETTVRALTEMQAHGIAIR